MEGRLRQEDKIHPEEIYELISYLGSEAKTSCELLSSVKIQLIMMMDLQKAY